MKILHTSDWHIGRRLHEQLQDYEQEKFLKWLLKYINENNIDVLLVSGDVFDTAYPSAQSMTLFYDFLGNLLKNTACKHIVVTAGNHDSPGTLESPKELMRYFSINMVGKAGVDVSDEILSLKVNDEELVVAAVPYLRDRDIRRAVTGLTFDEIEQRYRTALINHYRDIAKLIEENHNSDSLKIAMGHLFAIGAQPSETEQRIYVGGLGDITAGDFPGIFDYIALGHLHRPQKVDGKEHIRYSGSPYVMSFSETGYEKKVVVIETENNIIQSIDEITVPVFRKVHRLSGTLEECRRILEKINSQNETPEPWIDITLDNSNNPTVGYQDINTIVEGMNLKVLNVRLASTKQLAGIEQLIEEDKKLNDLKPEDVFRQKCAESEFNLDGQPEILDAFNEILNQVIEKE
jgi:exonuclease SbcD